MIDWDSVPYFTREEFGGEPDPRLLLLLLNARKESPVPFVITSGVRPDDEGSSHQFGLAADIRAHDSRTRYWVVRTLIQAGATRIGIYDRHIHVDVDPDRDPDVAWVGKSG